MFGTAVVQDYCKIKISEGFHIIVFNSKFTKKVLTNYFKYNKEIIVCTI